MTVNLIKEWIRSIEEMAAENDDEEAHIEEDTLIESTLEAIAKGVENPKELAIEALKVKKLDFDRYYA